jgi:membrane protein required for colicin V production
LPPLDLVALVLIGLLAVRGLLRGAVREAFALAALAAAVLAVRTLEPSAMRLLGPKLAPHVSPTVLRGITIVLLAGTALIVVSLAGAFVRRGLHAVGLGFADRIGGVVVGAAEGALLVAIALSFAGGLLGADHPWLRSSQAYAWLQRARGSPEAPPAVASPPPR